MGARPSCDGKLTRGRDSVESGPFSASQYRRSPDRLSVVSGPFFKGDTDLSASELAFQRFVSPLQRM